MWGFSSVDEMRKRENYTQATIGEGFPIIALGYKDGVLLVTKSNSVMRKIFGLGEGLASGVVGVYYHILKIRDVLTKLSRKNRLSLEKGHAAAVKDFLDREDGLLTEMGKEYYENILGVPYQVDVILTESRDSGSAFYRVDFRGLPYVKEDFIVCGGTEREDGEGSRQLAETYIQEHAKGKFATFSLNAAFRLAMDAFTHALELKDPFLNRERGEVLHVGILERDREVREPTEKEAAAFLKVVEKA
jgi:20S proteasome alpha/beta subunit